MFVCGVFYPAGSGGGGLKSADVIGRKRCLLRTEHSGNSPLRPRTSCSHFLVAKKTAVAVFFKAGRAERGTSELAVQP